MLKSGKKKTLTNLLLKESEITQYKNLNNASKYFDELKPGKTKIWYCKPEHFRDFCMGKDFLTKQLGKQLPNAKTIEDTHILIGSIQCEKLNDIFGIMQGESWSPNGEARNFLSSLGASHTSMSVGDIVEINGNFVMVDPIGFSKLNENRGNVEN